MHIAARLISDNLTLNPSEGDVPRRDRVTELLAHKVNAALTRHTMSMAAALLVIAQGGAAAPSAPVALPVTVSARILKPAVIRVVDNKAREVARPDQRLAPQRRRDPAGTLWIEFS
ncbi:MAG: hypothetical protein AAF707_08135 [Pseudomonadota bacterium]